MKLSFVKHPPPSAAGDQIDLDVTPVMSVLLVLIPFLVSMAVLTHLAVLQFNLPPNVGGAMAGSSEKPKLKPTVVLSEGYLALTLGADMLDSLPFVNGQPDLDGLSAALVRRRPALDVKDEVLVASADGIKLQALVGVMDRCKGAGFSRVGLSGAADGR